MGGNKVELYKFTYNPRPELAGVALVRGSCIITTRSHWPQGFEMRFFNNTLPLATPYV